MSDYFDAQFVAHAQREREKATQELTSSLFAVPERLPPHNGTKTSRAAARDKQVAGAAVDRGRILLALADAGSRGLTREEIGQILSMPGDTVRPRVWEMMLRPEVWARCDADAPLICEHGDQRATSRGKAAAIVRLTPAGTHAAGRLSDLAVSGRVA